MFGFEVFCGRRVVSLAILWITDIGHIVKRRKSSVPAFYQTCDSETWCGLRGSSIEKFMLQVILVGDQITLICSFKVLWHSTK